MRKNGLLAAVALLCLPLLGFGCAAKKMAAPSTASQQEDARRAALDKAATELGEVIYFDFDRSQIKPEARKVLDRKAEIMKQYPEMKLLIEGNGDERGTDEYNLTLGKRRAQAAADYLLKQGVAPARLSIVSYGKERPQDPAHTPTAWAKNRYVEFRASY